MTKAERAAATRAKYKALGLCYYCKLAPFVAGASMCEACSGKRKEYVAKRTADLLGSGVCYTCAKRPVVEGKRHCIECAARHAMNVAKRRTELRAVGVCPTCRKGELSQGGRGGVSRCSVCYEREQVRSKRNYAALKEAGLCAQCFKVPAIKGKTSCASCVKKRTLARFAAQGLTESQLDSMSTSCEACGSIESLHIDHDHAPGGKIRGMLCQTCNHALGLLNEDRNRMLALVAYLDKHKGPSFSDKFYRPSRWRQATA